MNKQALLVDRPPARYLDADQCGARYQISKRHFLRLVDSGKAPPPVRFGRSVRWPEYVLEEWDRTGNRPIRNIGTKGGAK